MIKAITLLLSLLILAGCASLQPRMDDMSIKSYQRGCALRGMQKGLTQENAQAVCQCHTEKAIAATSPEAFLATTERIAKASAEERQTADFKNALQHMRSTFNDCKKELGIQ